MYIFISTYLQKKNVCCLHDNMFLWRFDHRNAYGLVFHQHFKDINSVVDVRILTILLVCLEVNYIFYLFNWRDLIYKFYTYRKSHFPFFHFEFIHMKKYRFSLNNQTNIDLIIISTY